MTDLAVLKAKLQSEFARNGGQGAYAWGARELCGKAADAITALEARVAELEAMESRVRSALAYVDPASPPYSRDAIAADLRAGLSLRKAAYKHGTTFAIVRGIARTALEARP